RRTAAGSGAAADSAGKSAAIQPVLGPPAARDAPPHRPARARAAAERSSHRFRRVVLEYSLARARGFLPGRDRERMGRPAGSADSIRGLRALAARMVARPHLPLATRVLEAEVRLASSADCFTGGSLPGRWRQYRRRLVARVGFGLEQRPQGNGSPG